MLWEWCDHAILIKEDVNGKKHMDMGEILKRKIMMETSVLMV